MIIAHSIRSLPRRHAVLLSVAAFMLLGACAAYISREEPLAAPLSSVGANPILPPPSPSLVPTVSVPNKTGWPDGSKPSAASGLKVQAFASGLQHPRWLFTLPNGDVLVAEANSPTPPAEPKGIKAAVTKMVKKRAGADVHSANTIRLLRDADGDGVAEVMRVFIDNLHSPFGMALVGETLYVANTDAVVSFPYKRGQTTISGAGTHVIDLPGGPINSHWTRNIIASGDGKYLYATVGSNSNIAENGIAAEAGRAAIWEINLQTRTKRIFATGLRNPNGLAWEPTTGALWTVVNERDGLGKDLVPDYLTSVKDGAFYGWPYSYFGQHVDVRVQPQDPELVAKATVPDYALGAHVAALGLAFVGRSALPEPFRNGMFMGKAMGRPVGVALDRNGGLLVADDVGDVIWRVSADQPPAFES